MIGREIHHRRFMTVDQLQGFLKTAVDHHRAGKLGEAERLYRMVLQAAPNHPQALHHLGIIAVQCGKPEIGMDLIRRSVAIEPSAAAFNNLGEALRAMGRLGEAVDCYRNR